MSWGEAWRLTNALAQDPSSRIAAALTGWSHPLSHEGQALLDLFDLTHQIAAGKRPVKPHPRPWDPVPARLGKTDLPQDQVRALLAAVGPQRS